MAKTKNMLLAVVLLMGVMGTGYGMDLRPVDKQEEEFQEGVLDVFNRLVDAEKTIEELRAEIERLTGDLATRTTERDESKEESRGRFDELASICAAVNEQIGDGDGSAPERVQALITNYVDRVRVLERAQEDLTQELQKKTEQIKRMCGFVKKKANDHKRR